jgi:hypothetical protein
VVWFTDFIGTNHQVIYGENLDGVCSAQTTQLTRTREDVDSYIYPPVTRLTPRSIWRQEAEIKGLTAGRKIPYMVVSYSENEVVKSNVFSLQPLPKADKHLKILLTSDHQLMPMVSANLQKVEEIIGELDAVFLAGDLVNVADRASEWFDDLRGGSFFPCLQGKAKYELERNGITTLYYGGKIIQNTPLFPTVGNHEVMGRYSDTIELNYQFNDAVPNFDNNKNNSFNIDTYTEIFTLPNSKYYALTFGSIRLISLYITNIWRYPNLDGTRKGRYQEQESDLDNPQAWGYGQHIFEPISKGSRQYQWLEQELESEEFKQAKYKIVMFHHPPHTLGGNIVPPYTNPRQRREYTATGKLEAIYYDYPPEQDYIIYDVLPLLEKAQVNLVYYGHSHLWNRFRSETGINFLESSNVGNTYGAHVGDNPRPIPSDSPYTALGNPHGLEPIIPSLEPLQDENGEPLPYIASNDITVFSILQYLRQIRGEYLTQEWDV